MSSAAPGAARAKPDVLASLISRLPDSQDREWYASLVSYVQALPPQDELVKVAQLFGFLTLVGRQLPEALAEEQGKLRDFLARAYGALQQEVKTNGIYHEQLKERLSRLPEEIAAGVKPEAIAKAMSESFRQQLVATGIQDVQVLLAQSTRDLKRVTAEIDQAVQPMVSKYGGIARDMQEKANALSYASGQLQEAARAVDRKNAQLVDEIRDWKWWILPCAAVVLILLGAWGGVGWEQRHATNSVMEMQGQIQRMQDSIKALPAALAPPNPPSKRPKKTL